MRTSTVALVIKFQENQPVLLDTLCDEREILRLQHALVQGTNDPLEDVYQQRTLRVQEEEEFGNYVEDLLSQPFVRPEIQEQGLAWLKSKIRIEQHQKIETEAAQIIADFAYRVFQENQSRTDFLISGPKSGVRVRIFVIAGASASQVA
jgi:hypothetical protein